MPTRRSQSALLGLMVIAMTAGPKPTDAAAQVYADKANLLTYLDERGVLHPVRSLADWRKRRAHILANMQLVMGKLPDEGRRVPLDVQVLEEARLPEFVRRKISFAVEEGDRVSAYLCVPNGLRGTAPAVLCLHPTTPLGKAVTLGLGGKANRQYAAELAERGYVTLAPDYPNMGEYKLDVYARGYASATIKGIWNHRRALDLLQSLPEVDADRMGCIGHSLGGHNALFVAAFDERVKVVVTSCGFNSFHKYKGGDLTGWSHNGYMPRIDSVYGRDPSKMPFDFTEVLAAIAPRPVFINAPVDDSNFEVSGVHDCLRAARPVYALFGAEQHLVAVHPECGHDFPDEIREAAYSFVDRVFDHS